MEFEKSSEMKTLIENEKWIRRTREEVELRLSQACKWSWRMRDTDGGPPGGTPKGAGQPRAPQFETTAVPYLPVPAGREPAGASVPGPQLGVPHGTSPRPSLGVAWRPPGFLAPWARPRTGQLSVGQRARDGMSGGERASRRLARDSISLTVSGRSSGDQAQP